VWEVNGIELRSFGEVGRAFEEFDEADGLVARIDRGARTLRRSYRLRARARRAVGRRAAGC